MKKKYRKSKRYYYFRKQRWYGVGLLVIAILSAIILEGDITAAIIIAIPAIYLLFTKDMVITDDYFYEMEAKKFDKWKEP
jgi:hypothetical protein